MVYKKPTFRENMVNCLNQKLFPSLLRWVSVEQMMFLINLKRINSKGWKTEHGKHFEQWDEINLSAGFKRRCCNIKDSRQRYMVCLSRMIKNKEIFEVLELRDGDNRVFQLKPVTGAPTPAPVLSPGLMDSSPESSSSNSCEDWSQSKCQMHEENIEHLKDLNPESPNISTAELIGQKIILNISNKDTPRLILPPDVLDEDGKPIYVLLVPDFSLLTLLTTTGSLNEKIAISPSSENPTEVCDEFQTNKLCEELSVPIEHTQSSSSTPQLFNEISEMIDSSNRSCEMISITNANQTEFSDLHGKQSYEKKTSTIPERDYGVSTLQLSNEILKTRMPSTGNNSENNCFINTLNEEEEKFLDDYLSSMNDSSFAELEDFNIEEFNNILQNLNQLLQSSI